MRMTKQVRCVASSIVAFVVMPCAAQAQQQREDCWIDVKTGKPVPTVPLSGVNMYGAVTTEGAGTAVLSEDRQTAHNPKTGKNYARVPCPPETPKIAEQPPPKPVEQTSSVPAIKLEPSEKRILDAHNAERARYGYQPLKWNPALESTATAYANRLAQIGQLVHASREGRGIERENVNQGMLGWNTDQMLDNWLRERQYFIPGIFPDVSTTGNWYEVGHYSQMIWPETTDLGCGMAAGSGSQWLVCRYSPGGNKDGKPVGLPPAIAANTAKPAATVFQWIDVKTGKPVATAPISGVNISGVIEGANNGVAIVSDDRRTAFNPKTGQNFAKQPDGSWIDVKTGKVVASVPLSGVNISGVIEGANNGVAVISDDRKTAFNPKTGQNFAREPVQPAQQVGKPERGR